MIYPGATFHCDTSANNEDARGIPPQHIHFQSIIQFVFDTSVPAEDMQRG